jgi:Flagellar transcriptional activator (FlhC)
MHISNDRYFRERQRHDLALRMIRHEARTCTIKVCTGLTDDRIRRLCKTYEIHATATPMRRHRGKAPRQLAFFTRNAQLQFESTCLTSVFCAFGLLKSHGHPHREEVSIEYGSVFCDAFETHRQLARTSAITFEHAWFLLQQLNEGHALKLTRCRHCQGQFLRDPVNAAAVTCPTCRLKKNSPRRRSTSRTHGASRLRPTPAVPASWATTPEPAPH